ncbi:MAG: hypothetical protein HY321_07870 [Armatimonadetes bacterium]|nr:hypothetical protein [Armatimonadota bacterium]
MPTRAEELAEEIAALDESVQEAIWEHVAEISFRRGLHALSERYRERLRARGELNYTAEEIMGDLAQLREEVAARDYAG